MTMSTSRRSAVWLRPFSGEAPACPKCRGLSLITFWHPSAVVGECKEVRDGVLVFADDPVTVPAEDTEHLCRACRTCLYAWSERTADHHPSPVDD